jgi:putative transposase
MVQAGRRGSRPQRRWIEVESVNYQMRKASKTRGHFPDEDAALKLFRLIARDISTTRGGVGGTGTQGWAEALNAFAIHFPGRLNICQHSYQ